MHASMLFNQIRHYTFNTITLHAVNNLHTSHAVPALFFTQHIHAALYATVASLDCHPCVHLVTLSCSHRQRPCTCMSLADDFHT